MKRLALYLVVCSFLALQVTAELHFEELENLNPSQKVTLQKLKSAVSKLVPHDWMKEDINLVKYLEVTNFNGKKAEEMVKANQTTFLPTDHKFRKELKVDEWVNPGYFAEFNSSEKYPMYSDGYDKQGRPIFELFFGEWNTRAAAVAGKIKSLTYYLAGGLERNFQKVIEQQAQGKNVTQLTVVANMDGFSIANQACPTCLPLYLAFATYLEKHWPNSVHRITAVNTPESFENVLTLVRPILSPQTRKALKIFGTNKSLWKPYLDSYIDPKEISDWYDPQGKQRKIQ